MLDNRGSTVNESNTQVNPETNIYDCIIKALDVRNSLMNDYIKYSSEDMIKKIKEQVDTIDEHIEDFKAIATDQYDT